MQSRRLDLEWEPKARQLRQELQQSPLDCKSNGIEDETDHGRQSQQQQSHNDRRRDRPIAARATAETANRNVRDTRSRAGARRRQQSLPIVFLFWVVVHYKIITVSMTFLRALGLCDRSLMEKDLGALLPTSHAIYSICMHILFSWSTQRQVGPTPLSLLDSDSLSSHSAENAVLFQQDQDEIDRQEDMENFDLYWDCSDSS